MTVQGTEMANSLMAGKRGLIMGLANDKSIAWGIAKACADAGAELALTYQGEAFKKRVMPLAEQLVQHFGEAHRGLLQALRDDRLMPREVGIVDLDEPPRLAVIQQHVAVLVPAGTLFAGSVADLGRVRDLIGLVGPFHG